jgi:phosphoinositide-3-kinase, regulatory subunit 4
MGQSVSLAAVTTGSASIDVKELEDLVYDKSLSSARFMKCIRARHKHGLVVVKVAMRPPPDFKLTKYAKAIKHERKLLAEVPNALGYQRIVEGERCGYLVRQYLHSSLYDRMSTRPFLDDIEKKWLAFQLLCALRDCHSRNIYHGDIKTENILVTSWNWLYLTDFSSSFKKTYLPEDNPADFSYFFDISGRRTCYLAPERFLGVGEEDDGRGVTWAMDVFSVGCVIAELFVESPIFSLSQLFKYRKGEYDPQLGHLNKIEDREVRELVTHMIQVEPESRYSAEEYLNFWRRKAFPEYFYSFLHQYMGLITDPSSGHAPVMPDTSNFGEADERIDRIYHDFDKISFFLEYDGYNDLDKADSVQTGQVQFPLQIDIPNNRHTASGNRKHPQEEGTLIFLSLVVSSLRNTARATARIRACDLLLAFAERITDEAKLDRILPYLVVLLNDKTDLVKIAALRAMTQLLALIKVVSPVNTSVFTEYIKPRLKDMIWSPNTKIKPVVRATYAASLATLAHSSLRILDMAQALRAEGSIPSIDPEAENGSSTEMVYQNLYDVARSDLIEHFENHTKALLTDPDSSVRRAFLTSVSSLCVFFGAPKANDVILSHLNTYLNDKDWQLKCAFFQTIVGVATFVGSSSLEDFILPLMLQALTDPEEFVVERVIGSFASMAELGLFQRSKSWEMVDIVGRFMMHPNIWIRESAVHFVSATTTYLSTADNYCIIQPLIQPYLTIPITDFSETTILDNLKKPLARVVLDVASTWSQKTEKGLFWKQNQDYRTFSFGGSDHALPTISSKELNSNIFRKLPKNDEDEQWLTRLRTIGMTAEDEIKLLALRDYIARTSTRRTKETAEAPAVLQNVVKLQDLNITPQTIFFESRSKVSSLHKTASEDNVRVNGSKKPHTIADALLDASTTINDSARDKNSSRPSSRQAKSNAERRHLNIPTKSIDSRRSSSDLQSSLASSPTARKGSVDTALLTASSDTIRAPGRANTYDELRSDGTLTPTESIRSGQDRLSIRHKTSAISLLNRRDIQKRSAETGVSPTNATGEMDGIFNQEAIDDLPSMLNEQKATMGPTRRMNHTYEGTDPNVIKLLDNLASENYPVDEQDFGPLVTPINRKVVKRSDSIEPDRPWRPQGIHVATFGEHTYAINRILPSPDHAFFLTASDDGSVKVWDTLRLERNLIHRSRQTHKHAPGSQVKCVTFVENTHTFVSCATDGSVNVVKVDCTYVGDTTRYGKLRLKRTYQLPSSEFAVWVEHFRSETTSTLLLSTNLSRIVALDLRMMTVLYSLQVPLQYGTPTTFCLDRKHNWLLLGTDRGVLSLFDLRFHLHVKAWTFPAGAPIHRLSVHPFKGRGRYICMAGGTGHPDISVWDLEKMECKEIFRATEPVVSTAALSSASSAAAAAKDLTRPFNPISIPLTSSNSSTTITSPISIPAPSTSSDPLSSISHQSSFNAFVIASDTLSSTSDRDSARYGFLLTTGPDRKVRFWDGARPEASVVLSGLTADESQPRFSVLHPTPGLSMVVERGEGRSTRKDKGQQQGQTTKDVERDKKRESRVVSMAREQRALLRGHLDAVLDVAVLETDAAAAGDKGCLVVSVDRKGVIYVFQ